MKSFKNKPLDKIYKFAIGIADSEPTKALEAFKYILTVLGENPRHLNDKCITKTDLAYIHYNVAFLTYDQSLTENPVDINSLKENKALFKSIVKDLEYVMYYVKEQGLQKEFSKSHILPLKVKAKMALAYYYFATNISKSENNKVRCMNIAKKYAEEVIAYFKDKKEAALEAVIPELVTITKYCPVEAKADELFDQAETLNSQNESSQAEKIAKLKEALCLYKKAFSQKSLGESKQELVSTILNVLEKLASIYKCVENSNDSTSYYKEMMDFYDDNLQNMNLPSDDYLTLFLASHKLNQRDKAMRFANFVKQDKTLADNYPNEYANVNEFLESISEAKSKSPKDIERTSSPDSPSFPVKKRFRDNNYFNGSIKSDSPLLSGSNKQIKLTEKEDELETKAKQLINSPRP